MTQKKYTYARIFVIPKAEMTYDQYQRIVKNLNDTDIGGGLSEFETGFVVSSLDCAFCKRLENGTYGLSSEITSHFGIEVA